MIWEGNRSDYLYLYSRNTLLAANSSTFDRILACGVFGGLELMNKAYVNHFNLSMRAVPLELESRGFPQPTAAKDNLPGYLYRLVWCVLLLNPPEMMR